MCSTAPCQCLPLGKNDPDPPCAGQSVSCFVDPCAGSAAVCQGGVCGVQ
jgi:hypothetical protein